MNNSIHIEQLIKNLEKNLPLGRRVKILVAHACGLIAFEKPCEILTHPNSKNLTDAKKSLISASYNLEEECYELQKAFSLEMEGQEKEKIENKGHSNSQKIIKRIYILNRLDSPTSGIVLGSWDLEIAKAVRKAFKEGEVKKTYYAIVKGNPLNLNTPKHQALWVDKLNKENRAGQLRVKAGNSLTAKTEVFSEKRGSLEEGGKQIKLSLLKLIPLTGRTHQLRVQCGLHQCPILGDKTYGDFAFNREVKKIIRDKRLFLHAAILELNLKINLEKDAFKNLYFIAESVLPEKFKSFFKS